MTSRKAAVYVGAALLVAYFASANMPTQETLPPARAARPAAPAGVEGLAVEVRSQATKLHTRMAQAPVPDPNPRNPFSFGLAPRHAAASSPMPGAGTVHAAAVPETAVPVAIAPLPALTLMGIAEETTAGGPRRTAIIGGDDDVVYMVVEGQAVGTRYKVTKIGADAVELEDLLTKGYRRIALR
jgi:Tfp pilus assembly protein PilP